MALYKRGQVWWMSYTANGEQRCESTKTCIKKTAQQIFDLKKAEIIQGQFHLPSSKAPRLEPFAQEVLQSIRLAVTQKRYQSSVRNLLAYLGNIPLTAITAARVEDFKTHRLFAGVRTATVNRDLAVLRRMLRIAVGRELLTANRLPKIGMLEEKKERRQPHILTFEEEERLLATASDHIRTLVILILEAGLRSRREALCLQWKDIDFTSGTIQIVESKSIAGRRSIPMSNRCRKELIAWRAQMGADLSSYVFPKPGRPDTHLVDVRVAWAKALKLAGLDYFWIYDLRHAFATRLTEAGVSRIFVAQIIGHSNPNMVQVYAKATDEARRSAITKLETLRGAHAALTQLDHPQIVQ